MIGVCFSSQVLVIVHETSYFPLHLSESIQNVTEWFNLEYLSSVSHRYEVSNLAAEGKHLLGHFSMLLDMVHVTEICMHASFCICVKAEQ